ncbi:MAG: hypothetical protein IT320_07035 [Anaerolineae bacterium]|nr:hypothetical protein [Anaerolineae bacterium]
MQRLQEVEQVPPVLILDRDTSPQPRQFPEYGGPTTETLPPVHEYTNCTQSEPKYPTGFGDFTFEELYNATNRNVDFTLRHQLRMNNPEDIDDCMQSGYFKVWEQLQKQPEMFAGRSKRYIIQAVLLRSKAQRYAHLRHYRKIIYDADASAHQDASSLTISQVETWIDLAWSIQRVAEHTATLDNPIYLLALYTLITGVKTQDVVRASQHGLSTFTAAKRKVRATLAEDLPGYGNAAIGVEPLTLPKVRSFQYAQRRKQLITPILLDDIPSHSSPDRPTSELFARRTRMPQYQGFQEPISQTPGVRYETRWRGGATLEELLSDAQVRKVAFAKMRSFGYADEDAQDCFQLGTTKLWQVLQEQPFLLSDKGAAWVGIWIAHSGSTRSLWKDKARSVPFDDPDVYRNRRSERWASWATRVDKRIDFALLMNTLAQRYDGDPIKLFALYSLTTSVKMKDLLPVADAPKNRLIEARNEVRDDMREILEMGTGGDISNEFWTDQLQRVENLDCVTRVAERAMDDQRLLLALYTVTTSAKRKDVAGLFGIPLTKFRKEIAHIKGMLAEEYRKGKRK